jgi:hypothetical protein
LTGGRGSFSLNNLSAGLHNVTAYYAGDVRYAARSASDRFVVDQITPTIIISVDAIKVTENATIIITIPENVTGNVTVIVGNFTSEELVVENHVVKLNVSGLAYGNYTVVVNYNGDVNYTTSSNTTNLTVDKWNSEVKVNSTSNVYVVGDSFTIMVYNNTAVDNVIINGKVYSIVDGKVNVTSADLDVGHYIVTASIYENYKYYANTSTFEFDIVKRGTSISANGTVVKVGENEIINVTVVSVVDINRNITGIVRITINGTEYLCELTNGVGQFNISGLASGNYTNITVVYDGDGNYTGSTCNVSFRVVPTDDYNFTVITDDINFNENATIRVVLPNGATGNVTIYVSNGTAVLTNTVVIVDGVAVWDNIAGLEAGNHTVNVTYNGNSIYAVKDNNDNSFFVYPAKDLEIELSVEAHKYGDDTIFSITVPGDVLNNNVTLSVDGKNYTVNLTSGKGSFSLNNLSAGLHNVTAYYAGDVRYAAKSASDRFVVDQITPTILIDVDAIKVSENAVITITIPDNVTGNVTVFVGNLTFEDLVVENHVVKLNVSGLAYGNYTVVVNYNGDVNYTTSSNTTNLTVGKWNSKVKVLADNTVYGNDAIITVTVPSDQTGYATIFVDNKNYTLEIKDGKAVFNVAGLIVNTYSVDVKYLGDDKYLENANSTSFKVVKSDLAATVVAENVTTKDNTTFIVNVPEDYAGKINITVDGITYSGDVQSVIKMANLTAGMKTANVVFFNDSNYNDLSMNVTFKVSNITDAYNITTIKADNLTRGYNSIYDFQATFLDTDCRALANADVQFVVDGKTYTVKTNDAGVAQLTTSKLAVGTYNITSINTLTGEQTVNVVEIVKRIIEDNDLTVDFASGKSWKVKIIGDDGKPVGDGEIVDIYINTVHYVAKTDSKGYASLKINLNPATYNITAEYKTFKVEHKLIVKQTLKLVKKTVKVKKGKKLILKAKLKWSNGKPIKGKKIVFKFKGKKYKAKTNKKGIAKVKIKKKVTKKLKKGKKYKFTAKYITNMVKGKVKVKK